jgi:hypothetical protein
VGGVVFVQIEVFREIPFDKLAEMIRNVPLNRKANDNETIMVYKNANISLRTNVSPYEVNPTTFYLLQDGLGKQIQICEQLLKKGIDVFDLHGALQIYDADDPEYQKSGAMWLLTPPIIEVTPRQIKYMPHPGDNTIDNVVQIQIPIINDGAHRVYTALTLGRTFNAVWISGADERYPFYAHPNPWDMVKIVTETPKNKLDKKFYSRENVYGLYRDFGEIGCGGPRSPEELSKIYFKEQKMLDIDKKDGKPYTGGDV